MRWRILSLASPVDPRSDQRDEPAIGCDAETGSDKRYRRVERRPSALADSDFKQGLEVH